jgi:hypothetical protein
MIADGNAEQDATDQVKVTKRKPVGQNVIGNLEDF